MSTNKPASDTQTSRPLLMFGELMAICVLSLVGGALSEYWFGSDSRTWGSAIGALIGLAIVSTLAWSAKRQGQFLPWIIAVGACVGTAQTSIGRAQSLATEFGRFLGLTAGIAVLVLGLWALSKLTNRMS